jgi:hypothetical protein
MRHEPVALALLNSLLKRAGLPRIRFHDLLHTAVALLARDVNPKLQRPPTSARSSPSWCWPRWMACLAHSGVVEGVARIRQRGGGRGQVVSGRQAGALLLRLEAAGAVQDPREQEIEYVHEHDCYRCE